MSTRQKRILSIVLALSMIASLAAPGAASAAEMTGPSPSSPVTAGLLRSSQDFTGSASGRFTITLVDGYDTTGHSSYREGDTVSLKAAIVPKGVVFDHWESVGGGVFKSPKSTTTDFIMPAKNVTITAVFRSEKEVGTYLVTFDPNGGIYVDGGQLAQVVEPGHNAYLPHVVRYGYAFDRWDKSHKNITSDTVITAIWKDSYSDTSKPETEKPDDSKPDAKPDTEKPDTSKPDTSKPSTEKPAAGYTWEKTADGYNLKAPDGSYVSGWAKVHNKWYYCKNGAMQTGWLPLGSVWYYLKPSGQMANGWQQVGSTWYYLNDWGGMATGWLQQGNTWYYLNQSGAMQTGWHWIGKSCYYFDASGKMAANTTVGGYRLNKNGQWVR